MRALLVMPDYRYGGPYVISSGLMYVSSYLKRQGFDVTSLNLNHYGPGKLKEALAAGAFDVVATGGLFTYYAQIRAVIGVARRESPGSRVVLGGPIASADPEFALESLAPDYLVLGEGERPMEGLLKALEAGEDPAAVPGLAFKRSGSVTSTPPGEPVAELDSLPWPDYEGFEFGRSVERSLFAKDPGSVSPHETRRPAPVISGRGCAAQCTFCYRLTTAYRYRSIAGVVEEIRHLKDRYGVNEVLIADDLFSSTQARILDFCARIRPLGLVWACQLRVPVVTAPLLREMKESGCNFIGYGLESASPAVLRSMRKGINVAKMEEALRLTREAEITIRGNFIFGDPAETPETVEETLSFYRRHRWDCSNSISLGPVTPYPGTVLYRDLRARGRLRNLQRFYETDKDERGRFVNMTSMPDAEFQRLVSRVLPAEVKAGRVFGRVLGSRRLGGGVYAFSFRCPLCGRDSDGMRLEADPAHPVSSFRAACRRCLQHCYVPMLGLLGWRRAALFSVQAALGEAWERFKATDLFASVRYHPAVDAAWNRYKERLSRRSLREGGPGFHDLGFLGSIRARLGFLWELARGARD
ncbi:MAG: B12-binding domain-containing radical SAM protein [Elusimicrobia bacterium]|nr:B12-binding domain-containing radical SAM protein [Elusimicrobiota bacterium]